MLDLQAKLAAELKWVGAILAVDSTHYDTHYRSRHYERRPQHDDPAAKERVETEPSRTLFRLKSADQVINKPKPI
jgi:hypothetical protein